MTSCIPLAGKAAILLVLGLGACTPMQGDEPLPETRYSTPTLYDIDAVDDPLATGHLLMRAEQFELALRAYTRAFALGQTGEPGQIEVALGTVNARLGRLHTAKRFLSIAVEKNPSSIEAWNNLGVVNLSLLDLVKARNAFETAFALSSGTNIAARENLARMDEVEANETPAPELLLSEFTLVRHGSGRYLLGTPSGEGETE